MRIGRSPDETQRLVVRTHTPGRSALLSVAGVLAGVVCLWGAFEVGRWQGGYSFLGAARERATAGALEARLQAAEAQLATVEMARRIDRESYAQVEKSLADLQTRLGEERQELTFYRSIVKPDDGILGMRVQRVRVLPSLTPRHFRVRIVLAQAAREDAVSTATATFSVDGTRGGRTVSLALPEIGTSARVLSFSFRYFQEVETEIELPADLVPHRIQVEVRPAKGTVSVHQSYPWKIETN
jgi:hypothetical protein